MGKCLNLKVFLVVVLFWTTGGCIDLGLYESPVPLASVKGARIDPGLPGEWTRIDKEDEETLVIRILAFNGKEYVLTSPEGGNCSVIRAYAAEIAGNRFLNLQELGKDEKEFLFCRYILESDEAGPVLTLQFVKDDLFGGRTFKTSKKLNKFIAKHIRQKKLFDPDSTFRFRKN